ncbi:MAG: cache domain-containing protein, partial [Deltaproteobacteria bacterium]|nr:cache domain-containing protein [Deltaproteobacteria bacterium]
MSRNKSIVRLISWFMVLLIVLAVGSLGYLLISEKYTRFHRQLAGFQREFMEQQKIELKNQVDQAIEYIDYQLSQRDRLARQMLQQRVNEALLIADTVYHGYRGRQQDREDKKRLIKEILAKLRFDHGEGYYFIIDADGIMRMNPNLPQMEGVSLEALEGKYGSGLMAGFQKIANGPKEGFFRYLFPKPGRAGRPGAKTLKISFIKCFPPYNWYLGAGMYLDNMENAIQKQVSEYLNIHRFGRNRQNYVFIIKLLNINGGKNFGIMYANASRPDIIGKYISDDFVDAKGKYFRREFLRGLREKGECYVTYWYKTIGGNQPQLKTSYFKLYPKASLIVAAGAYHPDMEEVISSYRQTLEKNVRQDIRNIIFVLLFIAAILMFIVRFMSRKIGREFAVFTDFFKIAARENRLIDTNTLSLQEFRELAATVNQMVRSRQEIESSLRDSEEKFRSL